MTEQPVKLHADESVKGEGGSNVTVIRLPGLDRPMVTALIIMGLLTALALAISIQSAIYSFEVGRQGAQQTYWLQRNEAFLEQLSTQGTRVPPDLLPHKEK